MVQPTQKPGLSQVTGVVITCKGTTDDLLYESDLEVLEGGMRSLLLDSFYPKFVSAFV
jgi:hypothetical protein